MIWSLVVILPVSPQEVRALGNACSQSLKNTTSLKHVSGNLLTPKGIFTKQLTGGTCTDPIIR